MTEWTSCYLGEHLIEYQVSPKLIRLNNKHGQIDLYLMSPNGKNALDLALTLKEQYRQQIGSQIQISDHSLAIEIWAHAKVDAGGRILNTLKILIRLFKKIKERTEVFDMGEKSIDNNRIVWDGMALLIGWTFVKK